MFFSRTLALHTLRAHIFSTRTAFAIPCGEQADVTAHRASTRHLRCRLPSAEEGGLCWVFKCLRLWEGATLPQLCLPAYPSWDLRVGPQCLLSLTILPHCLQHVVEDGTYLPVLLLYPTIAHTTFCTSLCMPSLFSAFCIHVLLYTFWAGGGGGGGGLFFLVDWVPTLPCWAVASRACLHAGC